MENLLEIKDLTVDIMSTRGIVHALDGVDIRIAKGEIHGLVGESGCGKSMTAKSIMRLHDSRRSRVKGQILFQGRDILTLTEREMQKVRGARISMIFQDPMTALNPLLTVGDQIGEIFSGHKQCGKKEARNKTMEMLVKVGINPPEKRIDQYPFELSGGLQQRVMIAMAIACSPDLLTADEPTTALDVTIQAQILDLLKGLQKEMGLSILLITHNFGIVAEMCDRVSVMYAGQVVENAETKSIFRKAAHPYSQALINSIPKAGVRGKYLSTIPGSPPELFNKTKACAFAPRCPYADRRCDTAPTLQAYGEEVGHVAACHHR
ncbi:MAG: ABC transporter ATP-binding protein [Eubacteriales bacterium]